MNLNDTIKSCSEKSGLRTYYFVRRREANVRLDAEYDYPIILRLFEERIFPGRLLSQRRRTTTLFFMDALGIADPDTVSEVQPVVEKMEQRAFDFFEQLRSVGVEVEIGNMEPFAGMFDVRAAGVKCDVTFTYNQC